MSNYAVVSNDTITNVIVLEPADAPIFAFLGELVDMTGLDPQPGIGWKRIEGEWTAPVVVMPEPPVAPEPEPDPEPEAPYLAN